MRKRMILGQVITSAAVVLAGSACALGVGGGSRPGAAFDEGAPIHLQVTNSSGGPMEVYAAGSGTSYRVGTVHPGLPGRFEVRRSLVGSGAVEFTARTADGHVLASGPMLLRPGEVVDFALTPHAATSTAQVRAWQTGE
jgi:hypothetical protein